MIWPWSSCVFDLHLQSTVMISIVTGMTPWSPSSWSLSTCRHMVVRQLLLLQLLLSHSEKVKQNFLRTRKIMVSCRWRWRSWQCFGDRDQRNKMLMAISCHIFWLHVMFIFYTSYSALIDGSIITWSLTKFQGTSVLPKYAPLRKFVVMIGCDKLYVHIQRVEASFAHAEFSG